MTGFTKDESAFIPYTPMIPLNYPTLSKRMQFPVKICISITINKSQHLENFEDRYNRKSFFT